tara:strand:- start:1060 stop:1218 length:159 start_codon:yes stop_codon:yes gene_type:complete
MIGGLLILIKVKVVILIFIMLKGAAELKEKFNIILTVLPCGALVGMVSRGMP